MSTQTSTETTTAASTKTTTVDIVIRLRVAGSPTDTARYRDAIECLADVMRVQAEDGLWSAGYEDGGTDEDPNEYVADIEHSHVKAVLIDGTDKLTAEDP